MNVKAGLHFLRALLVLLFLMGGIGLVIVVLLVVKPFMSQEKYDSFAQTLQRNYLLVYTWCIEAPSGRKVYFSGDIPPEHESAIVIPNHAASHGDWAPLYSLAARSNGLGTIKTVGKNVLKYIPFFGWGMWLMNWPFLKRTWASDKDYLRKRLKLFKDSGLPMLLWMFCEGTRWTRVKHAKAVEFARSRKQYEPTHTLVPKCTGFIAMARGLDGLVTHVHDVTLAYSGYPKDPDSQGPGFSQIFAPLLEGGKPCAFHIHVRRIPLTDVPLHDEAKTKQFLFDMYQAKDALLKEFHKTGHFPDSPREIPLDQEASVQLLRHAVVLFPLFALSLIWLW